MPERPFDACLSDPRKVDKYQTAAFDGNRCSVPRHWAFQTVLVKGYVHRVEVVAEGRGVARHQRSYASGTQVLKPEHYLATLSRKPACLDHAPVFRDWKRRLPELRLRHRCAVPQAPACPRRGLFPGFCTSAGTRGGMRQQGLTFCAAGPYTAEETQDVVIRHQGRLR